MRKYDTCFFERYAQITLETLLGREFADLVNEDRPDLQSPDGVSIGIEVTRAMEQSKDAARSLLKEIAGIKPMDEDREDIAQIIESGYGYGLQNGRYIGSKELSYWSMALPLKRILESKVSKVAGGFYGYFDKMGLFVFCKDNLSDMEVLETCKHTMWLQRYAEHGYNRLYLSEISCLHVCNLSDNISDSSRIISLPVPQDMRKDFYLKALWEK
ncbi:MAG: hypothetical protein Q4G10_02565 [Bacteroidia bacterium]|nr:hypothetical protein [Bacteroidia bacterium]